MFINIKSKVIFLLLVLFSVLISYSESLAVPAAPILHTMSQSGGTTFKARQWGDENISGWETEDGYSIVFDTAINGWAYAIHGADGNLVTSSMVVGIDSPPDVPKRIRPIGQVIYKKMLTRETRAMDNQLQYSPTDISEPQGVVPPTGTGNIPVILINFNNTTTITTPAQFDTLLFGYGNNSMRDYYNEVSYGAFTVSAGPGGVAGWYTTVNGHDYYGKVNGYQRAAMLAKEAVTQADGTYDFAPYDQDNDCYVDAASIVHQGDGAEASGNTTDIHSHRWSFTSAGLTEYTTNDSCPSGGFIKINDYIIQPEIYYPDGQIHTVGVFAHEYGHALGLPDLYDTDDSSNGIGDWSLMASGSWNMLIGGRKGDRPAHMDAWSKYFLNWVTPTQVTGTLTSEAIQQAAFNADVYKIGTGTPLSGEYFLVENRQQVGFDVGLPGAGLLIWHIDGATISSKRSSNTVNNDECYPGGPPCSAQHYGIRLVQADGAWDLEIKNNKGDQGDPFPGTCYLLLNCNTSFNSTTSPNSNLYNGSLSGVNIANISDSGSAMTATFNLWPVLTVTKAGTGSGTVTSAPVGIDCGSDCTEAYNYNTSVTVTAVADYGSYFAGWNVYGCSSNICTVTMATAKTVTATFTLNTYMLTVAKVGTSSGTVTSAPTGINCGTDCTNLYNYNTVVTLSATPITGSYFAGWSGAGCTGTGTCVVIMDVAKSVTATFNLILSLTLTPDSTSIPRGGSLGYTVTVTNNSSISRTFKYWTYAILPNGSRYPTTGQLFGPITVTLTPGQTQSTHLTHSIPTTAPLGTYTYNAKVGPYPAIWTSDSFTFVVTP